jgi:hypothetical protein
MRIIKVLRSLAALLALAAATPAAASVTYVFNSNPNAGYLGYSATFTTADFLTDPSTTITSFDSCSMGFGLIGSGFTDTCVSIQVLISGAQSSIQLNGTTLSTFDPFAPSAFSTLGTNTGATYPNSAASTLVVSNGAGAVPEPATWAMMLLGFAGIGIAMQRRRRLAETA